jgi:DNA-binding beta-propeller fold protein YncE
VKAESTRRPILAGAILAAALLLALPALAPAAPPELLTRIPGDGNSGSEAGRFGIPAGIAADPTTGHVYVADDHGAKVPNNSRISEFTAWGVFVKAWGWDVAPEGAPGDTAADQLEICSTICSEGLRGSGVGQLDGPTGIAVDSTGDVYVVDRQNRRVQKFSSSGEFLLMLGGEVNKTTKENVCTKADLEAGEECGIGTAGSADGQFGAWEFGVPAPGFFIAAGPDDTVYVGDVERIQAFEPDGTFKEEIAVPGETISGLAVDAAGDFYVTFALCCGDSSPDVHKLGPTGSPLEPTFSAKDPLAIAVDPAGNVWAVDDPSPSFGIPPNEPSVVEFDPAGNAIIGSDEGFDRPDDVPDITHLQGIAVNSACGGVLDLYVAHANDILGKGYLNAFGPPPDPSVCPPPKAAPEIEDQYAVSVESDGALVRAAINPRFWGDTSYSMEYGTAPCFEGGCLETPVPPASLGGKAVSASLKTAGVFLPGLEPATTYHYRFVVQSGGGGPVKGKGGKEGVDGEEATFTTPSLPSPSNTSCPNGAFRTGASALLPDCRAYEMVSPVDKNNGDVVTLCDPNCNSTGLNQSSVDGEKLTYSSFRSFAGGKGAPYASQYLASRTASGWSTEAISPPRGTPLLAPGQSVLGEFRAFSPDLCQGWLVNDSNVTLAAGAIEGFSNVYRRSNCKAPGYEALSTVEPPNRTPNDYRPDVQGASADGSHTIFIAQDSLVPEVPDPDPGTGGKPLLYEQTEGELRLVCILPDGTPVKSSCSAGTRNSQTPSRSDSLDNAISEDGSRIFWSAFSGATGPGQLYLRDSHGTGSVEDDTTIAVSKAAETLSKTTASQFWTAAADGSKAIFTTMEPGKGISDLYEFIVETEATIPIAKEAIGLAGASEDASRIYFASKKALAPGATAGKPNLYLDREGEFTFIATLSSADAVISEPFSHTPLNLEPVEHSAQVSPDGQHLAFMSTASLTGYDNIDSESSEADAEVYLYDAEANEGEGELRCISCNPTGARPSGRNVGTEAHPLWAAAELPTWETHLYPGRPLSEDGSRLYFESFEPLSSRDTNGMGDVYQWEAEGKGDCKATDSSFVQSAGGCIALISSGESPEDSHFVDASPDGEDVFFATASSLLPQDPGLIDVYDARASGGFPPPAAPKRPCEGEACQSPPAPPDDPTPSSSTFRGPGTPKGRTRKPRCAKPKHRRKGRCVAKRHKRARSRAADHERRAQR